MARPETMTPCEEAGLTWEEYDAATRSELQVDSDDPHGGPPDDENYDWTANM